MGLALALLTIGLHLAVYGKKANVVIEYVQAARALNLCAKVAVDFRACHATAAGTAEPLSLHKFAMLCSLSPYKLVGVVVDALQHFCGNAYLRAE